MKTASIAALLLVSISFSHAEEPKVQPAPAPKVLAFPSVEDVTALRMAYAARPDFDGFWNLDPEREAVMAAIKSKDFPKATALAKTWLEKFPIDAQLHYLRGHFLKKAGDIPGSMYHFHCFYGLMRSITATGDGKSAKTAWKVISVSEEYALLNEIDAELIDQSLVDNCDKMHVKLPNGTETDLYFDVSLSLAATARQFAPDKK